MNTETLQEKKKEIEHRFEEAKKVAMAHEAIIVERQKALKDSAAELERIKGEYRLIETLIAIASDKK